MVLSGADRTDDGKERRVRGIWKPEDGGVRETAVTSTDGGKTWKPWFDLVFRPHK
jgi:DICT domain-containing protein